MFNKYTFTKYTWHGHWSFCEDDGLSWRGLLIRWPFDQGTFFAEVVSTWGPFGLIQKYSYINLPCYNCIAKYAYCFAISPVLQRLAVQATVITFNRPVFHSSEMSCIACISLTYWSFFYRGVMGPCFYYTAVLFSAILSKMNDIEKTEIQRWFSPW